MEAATGSPEAKAFGAQEFFGVEDASSESDEEPIDAACRQDNFTKLIRQHCKLPE